MQKRKQKFKLSKSLRQGVSSPSQGFFFKIAGSLFLILSIILASNIYRNVSVADTKTQNPQQVLGAFDDRREAATQEIKKVEEQSTKPVTQEVQYTVEAGDTLFNIAQKQIINWAAIATLNNLKAPYSLKPGMTLKLPVLE